MAVRRVPMAQFENVHEESGDTAQIKVEERRDIKLDIPYEVLDHLAETVKYEIGLMEEKIMGRIDALQRLIESYQGEVSSEEVVLLRSISREQAKEEIMKLVDDSDKLYYSEIAERLKLDLKEVVEIIEELEAEGKVGDAE